MKHSIGLWVLVSHNTSETNKKEWRENNGKPAFSLFPRGIVYNHAKEEGEYQQTQFFYCVDVKKGRKGREGVDGVSRLILWSKHEHGACDAGF